LSSACPSIPTGARGTLGCSNNTATGCAWRNATVTRTEALAGDRKEHFDVVLAAIAAGRKEILRLHRSGMIRDEVLRSLESDLDLEEVAARATRP
jgi:hypothetical protein